MSSALTQSDYRTLKFVAKSWLDDATEALEAIIAIRDEKLFKEDGYTSFEAFCEAELGNSVRRINQIIAASKIAGRLETGKNFSQSGPNESQLRALGKAPEEKQSEVWEGVLEECQQSGEKVTAKKVEEAVARVGDDGLPPAAPQHTVPVKSQLTKKDRQKLAGHVGTLIRALSSYGLDDEMGEWTLNKIAGHFHG